MLPLYVDGLVVTHAGNVMFKPELLCFHVYPLSSQNRNSIRNPDINITITISINYY